MPFSAFIFRTPAIVYPINVPIKELKAANVEKFLQCFCRELPEIRTLIMAEQDISEKYVYSYSSLRAFPLIKMKYKE